MGHRQGELEAGFHHVFVPQAPVLGGRPGSGPNVNGRLPVPVALRPEL